MRDELLDDFDVFGVDDAVHVGIGYLEIGVRLDQTLDCFNILAVQNGISVGVPVYQERSGPIVEIRIVLDLIVSRQHEEGGGTSDDRNHCDYRYQNFRVHDNIIGLYIQL